MGNRNEVLVAILNNPADFEVARDTHWYRVPVDSAHKWLKNRWPPKWLAFYQTKVFGTEAHALGEAFDTTDGWMGTQRALLLTIALAQK